MKKNILYSLFLFSSLVFAQKSITKELGGFSILKVYDGIDVEMIKSDVNKAVVTGEKASKVKFKSDNTTLKILLSLD